MAVKTMVVAQQCVQERHPRVHATKHKDQVGRLSHWCVWTRAFNGARFQR